MRIATLLLPLAGSALLAGCLRDADPIDIPDDAPAVFAILEAGADTATVLIARAGHLLEQPGYEGIDGAEVRLIHGADTVWATAASGSATPPAAPPSPRGATGSPSPRPSSRAPSTDSRSSSPAGSGSPGAPRCRSRRR